MDSNHKNLYDSYFLEVICRAQSIQKRCDSLLSLDFPSEAPADLGRTIREIAQYLEEVVKRLHVEIDWSKEYKDEAESFNLLKDIDSFIRSIASHLRYVDGARSERLPWSSISYFEKLISRMLPKTEVMLRPQWKYNFSVIATDLNEAYRDVLTRLEHINPGRPVEDVLKHLGDRSFHIVSFPSLERMNILLFCLIGHEIGHLYSERYIRSKKDITLNNIKDAVLSEVSQTKQPNLSQQAELIEKFHKMSNAWQHGLSELLADVVGTMIFGPAVLFSTLEYGLNKDLDLMPGEKTGFYPPWRYRLREIDKVIRENLDRCLPLDTADIGDREVVEMINGRYELIRDLIGTTTDMEKIDEDKDIRRAYAQVEEHVIEAKSQFQQELKALNMFFDKGNNYRDILNLINRIKQGIPPNAIETSIDDRKIATMPQIINTAWFYKITWSEKIFGSGNQFNDSTTTTRDIMNRLTLKAIEYSDVEERFNETLTSGEM